MGLFKIIDISEADFGCEERPDGPYALLKLEDQKSIEVSERWISQNGIEEGKYVWIDESGNVMKAIKVVAAIIVADKNDQKMLFSTQRGYGEFKDGWEFPGGKVEEGESPEQAIVREIKEELDTLIKVEKFIDKIEYDYPDFHLSMDCFLCSILEGNLVLKEHEAAKWLSKEDIDSVDWLPADVTIVEKVREYL